MSIKAPIPRKLSRLTILLVILLVLTAIPVQAANPNPGILPPNAHPFGLTYGEWSVRWWQWAFSIPAPINPLNDETGDNCGVGQSGHVWFLGGSFSLVTSGTHFVGTANRKCTIPVGTAVFFPVMNAEASTIEGDGTTEEALRNKVNGYVEQFTSVEAWVDGVPVEGLTLLDSPYLVESPPFVFTLPLDNIIGVNTQEKGDSSLSVSDGYWLMLAPLSAGEHTIKFSGSADLQGDFTFELDITYHLTVVPKSQFKH